MAIKIDTVDDGLPISVIVPLSLRRRKFFDNYVLPMIEANNPMEIIINDDQGSAPKKRNDGFKKSTQPYVFFCDDDIILPANALEKLYNTLVTNQRQNKKIAYSYSGYHGIVLHPETHPMRGNFQIKSRPFDAQLLKKGNYISTMSLIERIAFPMFDETLKRLQDWDIFLTMLENEYEGVFVPDITFFAYYLDEGITSKNNNEQEAMLAIIKKHNLGI